MPLGANALAQLDPFDSISQLDNSAYEFVPRRDSNLHAVATPGIPFVNVPIGSANPRVGHLNEHFPRPHFRNNGLWAPVQSRGIIQLLDGQHGFRQVGHGVIHLRLRMNFI